MYIVQNTYNMKIWLKKNYRVKRHIILFTTYMRINFSTWFTTVLFVAWWYCCHSRYRTCGLNWTITKGKSIYMDFPRVHLIETIILEIFNWMLGHSWRILGKNKSIFNGTCCFCSHILKCCQIFQFFWPRWHKLHFYCPVWILNQFSSLNYSLKIFPSVK